MHRQLSFKNGHNHFYILPTPIGNLDDITYRVIKVLKEIDTLYCEDRRITQKLLNHLEIKVNLEKYNDFSDDMISKKIVLEINKGKKVGLVSDAGMPGISDPGFKLIRKLKEEQINVIILPGATAFVLPMVYSSFSSSGYLFLGFLSKQKSQLKKEIQEIAISKYNSIIYETPHRLLKTLEKLEEYDAKRNILVARELTKIFEEYIEDEIQNVINYFKINKPRGEFVVIISPHDEKVKEEVDYISKIQKLIDEGYSTKDAVRNISKEYNVSKNKIYNRFLLLDKKN